MGSTIVTKPAQPKLYGCSTGDFSFFANPIKDKRCIVLKVQCIDSHIMTIQHLFDVIRVKEHCMVIYLRIRIDALQTLCQTFRLVSANVILCIVLPIKVLSSTLSPSTIVICSNQILKRIQRYTANTCTTKEYLIILDNALFSFAHVEPVSAVSSSITK